MRRGIVLIAVLLVTVAMAASLTAMLSGVRGQSDAVFAIAKRHEQRLAARSAAYAIAAEIGSSRDSVLAGELPEIASSASVIRLEGADGWGWSIAEHDGEPVIEALAGRIDANAASDEVVNSLLADDADKLLEARPVRMPGSLRAVLQSGAIEDETEPNHSVLLTLFSIDPQVRSGVGGPAGSRGLPRVGVESGAPTPAGLSNEGAALFAGISDGSFRPSSLGHVLREAEARGIPEEDWDLLVDAVYVGDAQPRRGLVDLNHASAEVLAALPGMDETLANAIVDRRESISIEDRAGLSWPVREGVIELGVYADLVDMLTVRSMQIGVRFRVEHEREELGVNEEFNAPVIEDKIPALEFYGIVDLAGGSPRFVYLRDVTYEKWQGDVKVEVEENSYEPESNSVIDSGFDSGIIEPIRDTSPVGGDVPDEGSTQDSPESQEAPGTWGRYVAGRGA